MELFRRHELSVAPTLAEGISMQIHAGYEISYDCPQPTPMILTLSVHPSRFSDLLTLDRLRADPSIPANTYHDGFGNFCHVIRAPAGRLTLSADFMIADSGAPDDVALDARQHALESLPVETLVFLLGSRYCETDRFTQLAWSQFGNVPKGGPWFRPSATMSMIASRLVISTRVRPRPRGMRIPSGAGCVEISPTLRSRSAVA
jgi:hypothetical protein